MAIGTLYPVRKVERNSRQRAKRIAADGYAEGRSCTRIEDATELPAVARPMGDAMETLRTGYIPHCMENETLSYIGVARSSVRHRIDIEVDIQGVPVLIRSRRARACVDALRPGVRELPFKTMC